MTNWPVHAPLRRPDRDDRLRLHRPRHPAAAGAAHRVRPLEVRGHRPGRHRPQAARRARAPLIQQVAITRDNYRQVLTPLLTGGPGRGMIVNLSVDTVVGRPDGALPGRRRHYIDTVCEPWPGLYDNAKLALVGALELRVARGRARRTPPRARRRHRGELLRRQPGHGVVVRQAGAARHRQGHRRQGRRAEDPRGVGAG